MSKTLIVKYFYKNKFFSSKSSGGEGSNSYVINKKITIGSDPAQFWQVFNADFPRKFTLLNKEKDQYYINLLKTFSIEIKRDGKDLSAEELKSNSILTGNRLKLRPDLSGKITLDPNTYFTFEYRNTEYVYDEEDRENLAIFNKKYDLSPELRHKRYAAIGVVVFVSILYIMIGLNYEAPKEPTQFEQEMTAIQTSIGFKSESTINKDKTARALANSSTINQPPDQSKVEPTESDPNVAEQNMRRENLEKLNLPISTGGGVPNLGMNTTQIGTSNSPSNGGPTKGGGPIVLGSVHTGVKGSRRNFGMQGVQSTVLNEEQLALQYSGNPAGTGDALTSSASNIMVSDAVGGNLAAFNSEGKVNTRGMAMVFSDMSVGIDSLNAQTSEITSITTSGPQIVDVLPTVNTDSEKKRIFAAWFDDSAKRDIQVITSEMQRTMGLRGSLVLRISFKDNVVKKVDGDFTGNSDSKKLIQQIKKELMNRQCAGLGDFEGVKVITIR